MTRQRLTRRFVLGLLAAAALPALPAASAAAPRNDDYQHAHFLAYFDTDDAANQNNVGATEQPGEPLTPSGTGVCGGAQMTNTVWYLVRGNGHPVTVETRGSRIDTNLAVYDTDGSSTPDNGPPTFDNALDCSTDLPGDNVDERASEVTFDTASNLNYLVQIGSCSGSSCATPPRAGEGTVVLNDYDTPPHDSRADPAPLMSGAPKPAWNFGATVESGEKTDCGGFAFGKTVWFSYTAPQAGTAVFSASGSAFDSVLAVHQGSTVLGCNDDGGQDQGPSRLSLHVSPGTYLVQVGGFGDDGSADFADFTAQVEFTADPPPKQPPAPDRDGDGIPDASDRCPDQNARARDADVDGCLDPVPPATLRSTVTSNWSAFTRYTLVRTLVANQLPAGATVKVTCRSKRKKRCPYRSRTYHVRSAKAKLNLRKPFRKRKLPVRTLVTVQITAPGYVGKVVRFRIRKRKLPRISQLCLQPGAKRAGPCS